MSWLDKILPSRIRAKREGKASVPEGLWHKCSNCETVIYRALYITVSQFEHLCHNPSGTDALPSLFALILDGNILSNQLNLYSYEYYLHMLLPF